MLLVIFNSAILKDFLLNPMLNIQAVVFTHDLAVNIFPDMGFGCKKYI